MKLSIAAILIFSSIPVTYAGEYQPGFSSSRNCIENEYREEYVPGTKDSPGYVRSWTESINIPCDDNAYPSATKSIPSKHKKIDNNDCSEGSLIGGILGAGLATKGSRGKDRWLAIPAGAFGGAMLGCQIDGG